MCTITREGEKLPVLCILQRIGDVVIQMVPNVQHVTIQPLIIKTIAPGSLVYTDEYDIYDSLPAWGYQHKSVNHAVGEFARDEDGDGFHEVHVNTLEGFWSLLRSWLRPHRVFRRNCCPGTWAFSSSFTMSAFVAKHYSIPFWLRL